MADGIECGFFPDKLNSSGDSSTISYDCKFELEVIDSSNFVYLVNTNANFCHQKWRLSDGLLMVVSSEVTLPIDSRITPTNGKQAEILVEFIPIIVTFHH